MLLMVLNTCEHKLSHLVVLHIVSKGKHESRSMMIMVISWVIS